MSTALGNIPQSRAIERTPQQSPRPRTIRLAKDRMWVNDLTEFISERSEEYVAGGGQCDLYVGTLLNYDRTKMKVALKRVRLRRGDDDFMKVCTDFSGKFLIFHVSF